VKSAELEAELEITEDPHPQPLRESVMSTSSRRREGSPEKVQRVTIVDDRDQGKEGGGQQYKKLKAPAWAPQRKKETIQVRVARWTNANNFHFYALRILGMVGHRASFPGFPVFREFPGNWPSRFPGQLAANPGNRILHNNSPHFLSNFPCIVLISNFIVLNAIKSSIWCFISLPQQFGTETFSVFLHFL
jgi:hypothetical protein